MELAESLLRRRMVRSFSGESPDPATLHRIFELALRAPSAGNSQGWDAVVLEGPNQTETFWATTTTAAWRERSRRWEGLQRAPVVVVLFADPGAYLLRYRQPDKQASGLGSGLERWPVPYWDVDTGMAALLLLLAAVDSGLGACFLGNFRGEDELRLALGVPADRRYVGAVLIGSSAAGDPPASSASRPRRRAEDVFHRCRW